MRHFAGSAGLAHIYLDMVLLAVIHKGDYALPWLCSISTDFTCHGTIHRHAYHMIRYFTDALDCDVVEGLAIAIVHFVRLPMGRDTRRNA
ncbi:MAG: hypothetical protein WBF36_13745, partial [Desulfobulbales bacterium]